jgi:hypothetical protein
LELTLKLHSGSEPHVVIQVDDSDLLLAPKVFCARFLEPAFAVLQAATLPKETPQQRFTRETGMPIA